MTRLEKYEKINKCMTRQELIDAIQIIAEDNDGLIHGRTRQFSAIVMALNAEAYFQGEMRMEVMTREYGIRQQALMVEMYDPISKS